MDRSVVVFRFVVSIGDSVGHDNKHICVASKY